MPQLLYALNVSAQLNSPRVAEFIRIVESVLISVEHRVTSVTTFNQLSHLRAFLGSGVALIGTVFAHQRWVKQPRGTTAHGLLDLACHLGVASAVTLPVLPQTKHRRDFGLVAIGSAVTLDLDHVLAARSLEVNSWMTMPSRPPTHSFGAMIVLAWIAERLAPGKRLWLAVLLGVGSHLLRDLATGGAPLWHPRRVITWPAPAVLITLIFLTISGWFLAGIPIRHRGPRIRYRKIEESNR
jgi:membrane-bound metal-dependent hydrolase YbcI (DUF457 family)